MQYFDSHLHLTDDEYSDYLNHIIFSLRCLRITACSVTVNLATSKKSLALFNHHKDIINQFIGIHPEFAIKEDVTEFSKFFENNLNYIDGIGEIGLDLKYINQDKKLYSIQKKTFHALLGLAEKYNKPTSIHSRKSLDDILQILTTYKIRSSLLHWFDGSKKQLKKAMDMGVFVSFGPVLLYSPDKKVLLTKTNIDKILVETDGPVRYSNCFNFLPSSSISHLFSVIKCMGDILNLDFESISELLKNNSELYLMKSK